MNVAHPLRTSETEWSSWTSIRLSIHSWRVFVENWIDAWKRLFSDKVPLLLHFLKFYLLTSKVSSHLVSKEGHEDSVTSSLTSTQMLMSRPFDIPVLLSPEQNNIIYSVHQFGRHQNINRQYSSQISTIAAKMLLNRQNIPSLPDFIFPKMVSLARF